MLHSSLLELILCLLLLCICISALGQSYDPTASGGGGRKGVTLYVSKLGSNKDGKSWATAFRTIQAALDAVPDDKGGHVVIVRPDVYMEANLSPARRGAVGAYNALVGDENGRLGSGAVGRVTLDSGDPEKGFKSYDWWGPIRATQQGWSPAHTDATFSAIGWDRWILRGLYVTGGDGGLMWDCTDHVEPFTVIVEDCVSIGRAFGGGVASCLSRPEEPITFRRCNLWALDWWGDTAGAYVRVENPSMPEKPDVVFEDCTMVGPQCALKGGNFGFHTYMRVKVKGCRLAVLNFSQPQGTPTDGIVQSVEAGKYLHVDFEDSLLMGYKVFGVRVHKETEHDLGYTVRGDVRAYVQYQQACPGGMLRLGQWPAELFEALSPPPPPKHSPVGSPVVEEVRRDMCEVSPFVWHGRLCLLECERPADGGSEEDYHLVLRDAESHSELARFGQGYGLASAFVFEDRVYVFASRYQNRNWNDVTQFDSADLKTWRQRIVVRQNPNEHLFNSSVCRARGGFVLVYESDDPAFKPFTAKFARSRDLERWTKAEGLAFGRDRYAACPCIRYANSCYYLLYTEQRSPRWSFETYIARSRDLRSWELSAANPVLSPQGLGEGIDASDPDLVEFEGKTYLYYSVGDQRTWMNVKRAIYPMTLTRFLSGWFAQAGIPDAGSGSIYRP